MDKEDVVHIYNGILLSHKEEWNNAICSNVDGPRDYHTKGSKSERERQIPYDITYTWNLKYNTNKLIYNQKQTHKYREKTCGRQREGVVEEGRIGSVGLADANYYIENGWTRRSYCTAQETMFNILW